ncbi:hypothetical protein PHYBLDRAFT_152019 [Phycomyces blakesleeanus NRRL 1555(-)]|uniref:Uncharacterized protein n=1 Tax=Phycomyces blakesleeanus (strain ATCC 8743b / DSM 1359 / FGSC 10004 / NBRC 33097 / NRRL 1555) TaxID=763407 RepID=A0A167JUW9_PHYB8|nr:hypothetical protein PHYBLDRAFT_152019 [Phycomyces blakesleeanus NRRL 1555(-)]OAD66748.1 hypothetical protein PHYBLDRAFT_152019 [Phycomyces blakesleeanus NRRL 1555(-)]|eukprot:XP_018284788.1 hypothetical protein PHYBLDRAFT_152019 [Phycomyces blakesleeanus NRRL 1555(-)]
MSTYSNIQVKCICFVCSPYDQAFEMMSKQTYRRHASADLIEKFKRVYLLPSTQTLHELNDNDMEIDAKNNEVNEQIESTEDLPAFTEDLLFDSESDSDDDSIESEAQNTLDALADLDDSEDIEENFSSSEMPTDLINAFIASFAAFFISKYVVNSVGAILIKFLNKVPMHFGQSFRLPLSSSGLSVPQCCNFQKLLEATCRNQLFLSAPLNSSRPKRAYLYNSITSAFRIFFCHPGFEAAINAWRYRHQVPDMMFDIYNGAKWAN